MIMNSETLTIPITSITIGPRHRKDMGDIPGLAESIENQGLLQPIGITENKELVFGARRIAAYGLLGRTEIECRVVNVTSIIEGEYAENEIRKNHTRSEQVAILAAIEEKIGKRQGQRSDLDEKEKLVRRDEQLQEPVPEVTKGQQTRDFLAQKAGLGSGKTYQQAKKVVEEGTPELVAAMDTGQISVRNAAALTKLPPEEQRDVLKKDKDEIQKAANNLRTDRPKEDKPKEDKPDQKAQDAGQAYTQAHRFAIIAISHLEHIYLDDPLRTEALVRVRDWIDEQLKK
jgi:ParB-like chromosome segregation protein Spo0J